MSWGGQGRSYGGGDGKPSSGGGGYGGSSHGGGGGSYGGGDGKPSSGGGYGGSSHGGGGSGGGYSGGSGARPTPSSNGHHQESHRSHHQGAPSYGGSAPPARPSGSGGGGGGGGAAAQSLQVTGCSSPTVANIIKGLYSFQGTNHGKPTYKKEGPTGTVSVLIYFWDDRDGASFSGWWFGPKVGGDQVWAYNGQKSAHAPPPNGWKVPWDGAEDASLRIAPPEGGSSGGGGGGSQAPSGRMAPPQGRGDPRGDPRQQDPRAAEDDRRRRQADQERQSAEQQRQKDKQAQERAAAERENQRREDDRRRRAAEDAERQRKQKERDREQEERRRAEDRKKREEEEIRRKEQAAALIVRKVIQRIRIATPENYDGLRNELEEAQSSQLKDMGSQAEKVGKEAETALQQAQQRIDEINEKQKADEKRKQEEEKKRKEDEATCTKLMEEATQEVKDVDAKVSEASDAAKSVSDQVKEGTPDAIVEAAGKAEATIKATLEALDVAAKSLNGKRQEMGHNEASRKVRHDLDDLERKVSDGRRSCDRNQSDMKRVREKAAQKASALKKLAQKQAGFVKYDLDGDGKLSREEVKSFGMTHYQFEVPEETLAKVMKSLEPIVFEKFDRVRAMVAIAKSEIEARKKRAEAEEKKKAVELAKAEMQKVIDEAAKFLVQAEDSVSEAENMARPLSRSEADNMSADKLKEEAAAVLASAKGAEDTLSEAMGKLTKVEEDCAASDDLNGFDKREVPRLKQRHSRVESRLEKVTAAAKAANEKAVRKAYSEIEQKRTETVTAMRAFMTAQAKSGEQLFEHVGAGSDITSEKFAEFLKDLPNLTVEKEQVEKLFQHIAGESEGAPKITKEMFLDLIRLYYKCVKATVLTEDITIKSKVARRLELYEVLEVLEGPTKEEGVNVQRVKVQAVNDAAVGWATIAGNQGTPFLEPGGNLFTCVKETHITDAVSITDSKTVRKLAIGEVVEVLEFAKKDAQGIKRVKAKAKEDGAAGWITVCGNQGTAFLEPC